MSGPLLTMQQKYRGAPLQEAKALSSTACAGDGCRRNVWPWYVSLQYASRGVQKEQALRHPVYCLDLNTIIRTPGMSCGALYSAYHNFKCIGLKLRKLAIEQQHSQIA